MLKRREVVLARVFFSDSPESKVRPAIILSDDKYHATGFFLAAAITTSLDEHCMPVTQKDINCPLEKGSSARFDGVIKLHSKQALKSIGKVTPDFHSRLVEETVSMIK
jgi:mRNA-degrading endonuclease toxin of MazEF toxin-antitoxin module